MVAKQPAPGERVSAHELWLGRGFLFREYVDADFDGVPFWCRCLPRSPILPELSGVSACETDLAVDFRCDWSVTVAIPR